MTKPKGNRLPRQIIEDVAIELTLLAREPQLHPIMRTLLGPIVDSLHAVCEVLDFHADEIGRPGVNPHSAASGAQV